MDFSGLSAVILNCTLKRPERESHTGKLLSVPGKIMRRNGVAVEEIRPATMPIAFGVQPDMTEHGWAELSLPSMVGRGVARLGAEGSWQIAVVYRGRHCRLCRKYLKQLDVYLTTSREIGAEVIAISGDPRDRAEEEARE